jgi:hypothetical protein
MSQPSEHYLITGLPSVQSKLSTTVYEYLPLKSEELTVFHRRRGSEQEPRRIEDEGLDPDEPMPAGAR